MPIEDQLRALAKRVEEAESKMDRRGTAEISGQLDDADSALCASLYHETVTALCNVVTAARDRHKIWTRESYAAVEDSLKALDMLEIPNAE